MSQELTDETKKLVHIEADGYSDDEFSSVIRYRELPLLSFSRISSLNQMYHSEVRRIRRNRRNKMQ